MRTYLMILCASLFGSAKAGDDVEKNEFDMEVIANFKGMVQTSWTQFDQKYFSFKDAELDVLCTRAQRFSLLDGSNPGAKSYAPFYNSHQLVSQRYKRLPYVRCRTIPTSYLYLQLGESNPRITIVMERNRFMTNLSDRFHVTKIESEPTSSARTVEDPSENLRDVKPQEFESSRNDEDFQLLKKSHLFQLSNTDRLHLCFAAREAIRLVNPWPQKAPELLSENMKKVDLFDVQFTDTEKKEKNVLLSCHSSPSMYVGQHVEGNLRSSDFMQVLLVSKDDVQIQPRVFEYRYLPLNHKLTI